jgi:uncharacterized membrane protein YdjX (TVP38/TMEM64 family)
MDNSHWDRKRIRSLVIILAVAGALIGGFFALRSTGQLAMFASAEAMQTWVAGFGVAAPAVFFAVQALQVIVSPIPGNVTTLVGGMMFGFWTAFALSTAAVLTGSLIAFALARAFGRPLVVRLVGPKIAERYLGVLSSQARIVLVLMLLLPFFPDDALSLVAGLTSISWSFFALASVCTRPWGLLFSSLVGAGMVQVPLWGWALIAAGTVALAWASIKWGPTIEHRLYARVTRNRQPSTTHRVSQTSPSRPGSAKSPE